MSKSNQIALVKEKIEKQEILLSDLCVDSPQTKEVKQNLISCLIHIMTYPNMCVNGNNIDSTISNEITSYCECIEISKLEYVQKYKKHIHIDKITGDVYCDIYIETPLIVRQPNGGRRFPDVLLLWRNTGIQIEVKSSKDSEILKWNDGIPKQNSIYIFNGTCDKIAGSTTIFLGKHIISHQEREILFGGREACKQNVKATTNRELKTIDSQWSLYARPQFNRKSDYLSSPDRSQREQEVLDFIKLFDWNKTA